MKPIAYLMIAALAFASVPDAAVAKGPKHCPPGLAKKNPACVPPGQAKKGVTYDQDRYQDRDHDENYNVGDRIDDYTDLRVGDRVIFDGHDYVVVKTDGGTVLSRDDDLFRLPTIDDDLEYVRVGDAILRVSPETRTVIDFIQLADLILR